MEVVDSEMDFIDDVEYFGLRLLLLFVWGCVLLFFHVSFLVSVYTLSFHMVCLSLGPCIERRNLVVYILKNWLSRDGKISGLAINE